MKPPIAYYGGKTSMAPWIVEHFPAHFHYVEPFAGSLAVLFAKGPSPMETVNDLDRDLMTWWRVLRNRPADLERVCALTPHSRLEHAVAYENVDDELEQARRVWVRLSQGRAGTLRKTGWRHYVRPTGTTSMPEYLAAYVERVAYCAERLHEVSLECRPAAEVIAVYGPERDCLLYIDPPYLTSTRTSVNYRHEMGAEAQHRELAEQLFDCDAAVVLSGYASALYDELYADWDRVERRTYTGQARTRSARIEVLWSNRPINHQAALFALEEEQNHACQSRRPELSPPPS
jgi:DNA adenine methylase